MRVSIVVCNYNYARYLDGAIRSALDQDWADKEVIVVDDGSTDDSRVVLGRWGASIVTFYKENGGQISAYNAGFERATGDVVLFLDADDVLDPMACSRVVRALRDRGSAAKVHFRLRLVDDDNRTLGAAIPSQLAAGDQSQRLLREGELYDSSPGSGNAYRTAALRRLMPLPEDAIDRHGADFFAIYGTALLGEVAVAADEPLASYRVHRRGAAQAMSFGNALADTGEPYRTQRRYARLQRWIADRLGPRFALPPMRPNFSLSKQGYAAAVFAPASYVAGLREGSAFLMSNLGPAIAHVRRPWPVRIGLGCWAVAVLVLPRTAGLPLARYVCNPASR